MLQLEELQEEQPLLPPTATGTPSAPVLKQAKRDSARSDSRSQVGQGADSVARLIGRINSNRLSQSVQTYS